jgi:hypothetical protein
MSAKTLQCIGLRKRFLRTKMKRLSGAILVLMAIQLQQANAQDLVLQDTTITTTAIFSANSITAGPNFTIASTGDVILSAETIAVIPQFFVVQGGKLQVVSGATPVSVAAEIPIIPDEFIVHQNFPNPFNPTTTIQFDIPVEGFVTLRVVDVLGNEIAVLVKEEKPMGKYEVEFDASNLSSGVYFYRLQAGDFIDTKKMVLIPKQVQLIQIKIHIVY